MCIRSIIIYSFFHEKIWIYTSTINNFFPQKIFFSFSLMKWKKFFSSDRKKTSTSVFIVHPFIIILPLRKLLLLCISVLAGGKKSERHNRFHIDKIHTHILVHHISRTVYFILFFFPPYFSSLFTFSLQTHLFLWFWVEVNGTLCQLRKFG
jgi:hypothetical protein